MYLNRTSVEKVMELISQSIAEKEGLSEDLVPPDFNKLIIVSPPHVFDKVLRFVKEHKMEIINKSSNRYIASVLVHLILSMGPETRNTLRNPPQEIIDFLREYLAYYDGKEKEPPVLDRRTALKYAKYLMVPVDDRYLVLPSEEDLAEFEELRQKKQLRSLEELVSYTIAQIYLNSYLVNYDTNTRTVYIDWRPIYRIKNDLDFIERAEYTYIGKLVKSGVVAQTLSLISEIFKGLELKEKYGYYVATAKASVVGELLGVNVPDEMRNKEISLEFIIWIDKQILVTRFRAESEIFENLYYIVSTRVSLSELDDLNSLREIMRNTYSLLLKTFPEREKLVEAVTNELVKKHEFAKKHGFVASFGSAGVQYTYKTGSYEAELYIINDVDAKYDAIAYMTMKIRYKREIDVSTIKTILREHGYPVDYMSIFSDDGAVEIHYDKYVFSVEEGVKFAEQLINLRKILYNARKEYLEAKRDTEKKQKQEKTTAPEEAFALYLVYLFDPVNFKSNVTRVQEQVRKLLSSIGSKKISEVLERGREMIYNPLLVHKEEILSELFLGGYIKLLEDDVEILGKKLSELLRGLGYNDYEVKRLIEKVTDEVSMSLVILRPSDFAKQINGETLWSKLPRKVKEVYLDNLTPDKIAEIMNDPNLATVFSDVMNKIIRDAIERGDPVMKTLVVHRFKPELIGTKHRIKITDEPGVPVIDAGMFYVHINEVGRDFIDYIIYRKDVLVGVVFRGRTLSEAISRAIHTYDKAVEKAKWIAAQEKKIGKLIIPLDSNGKLIRGDDIAEENTRHEELTL